MVYLFIFNPMYGKYHDLYIVFVKHLEYYGIYLEHWLRGYKKKKIVGVYYL